MNGNVLKYLQVGGQWLLIVIGLVLGWQNMDRRVTVIETNFKSFKTETKEHREQEQKGYNIVLHNMVKRLDRMDEKLDKLIEKAHVHQ